MIDMLDSTVETAEETYADIEGVEYSCEQEDGKTGGKNRDSHR